MTNFAGSYPSELRIVYWGPESVNTLGIFDSIAEGLAPSENCGRTRFPTSIDPASWYEELSLALSVRDGARSALKLVSTPSAPDLAPSRLQLLDGTDAMVVVIDPDPDYEKQNLASLKELRSALAAYGRVPGDLPLAIQYTREAGMADFTNMKDILESLQIVPVAVYEVIPGLPKTFREPLASLVRALGEHDGEPQTSLETDASMPASPHPDDPWLASADSSAPANESAISAMLEASILAESASNEVSAGLIDIFLDPPARIESEDRSQKSSRVASQEDFEIASAGAVAKTSSRRVQIPLALSGPGGKSVPLTLHIELEVPQGGEQDS